MKIAACVILYNPTKNDLINIDSYINVVDHLYIYDNTETESFLNYFKRYGDKISYYQNNENQGIAKRLNQACVEAIHDNYDYLLTMDQDSSFIKENLIQYFYDILNYQNPKDVSLFGIEHFHEKKSISKDKIRCINTDLLITSGSVINLSNYIKVGGFDEQLFIDGVDLDYCLASKIQHLKCILFKNNFLTHSLGEKTKKASIKTLYLIKKNKAFHSPIRIYYMRRNSLYLKEKYKATLPVLSLDIYNEYNIMIKINTYYAKNIFEIMRLKRKAKQDFLNQKMGKFTP